MATMERAAGPHRGLYCADCGGWIRWVQKQLAPDEALEFVMPFGKHKGEKMGDIPDDYLDWVYENCQGSVARAAGLAYEAKSQGPT